MGSLIEEKVFQQQVDESSQNQDDLPSKKQALAPFLLEKKGEIREFCLLGDLAFPSCWNVHSDKIYDFICSWVSSASLVTALSSVLHSEWSWPCVSGLSFTCALSDSSPLAVPSLQGAGSSISSPPLTPAYYLLFRFISQTRLQ